MDDESMVKIVQSLGLNFNPAEQSIKSFESRVALLNMQLANMKSQAISGAKDINQAFSSQLGNFGGTQSIKSVSASKIILDQYGNTLAEIGKKTKKAKDEQMQYNKELAELIHLRKTQQIDAQTFVEQASPFRTNSTSWESLQKQEQIKLVQELTRAEAEHRKILDEKFKVNNSINASQAENVQEVKQSLLASMEAQAASIQQKASAKGLSEEYRIQAALIRNQVAELQQKLVVEGKLTAEEAEQVVRLQEQLSILRAQTGAAISDKNINTNIFAQGWARRAEWFMSGSLFFGLINGAKEAVKAISDVEMGVTQIARVMEDSTFVFNDFRDNLLGLGVDYGQTFDNVQDITLRFAQAGYNVNDSLDLTKTALLALNTAELDAKNATESMIGIMAQWKLTADDLPLVLDKINKTADDFTVTSQDLVDGLLRSSGAARIMGLSLDQTISLLTVMREASGRTGREVGKQVAPYKRNLVTKHVLNSGEIQRWIIVSQAA